MTEKEKYNAGSVVTRDIATGVIAVGNPCRILRKITNEAL